MNNTLKIINKKKLKYQINSKYYVQKTLLCCYVIILFLISGPVSAYSSLDVVISEIAWMGTLASDDDEWIELYNNTESEIDLSGWTLSAQDGVPKIILMGKIQGRSFYILERTDDTTINDLIADQIYTGAMTNSGEYLFLKDKDGNIIDQVDTWHAGDSVKRATMERINVLSPGNLKENWKTSENHSIYKDSKGNTIIGSPKELFFHTPINQPNSPSNIEPQNQTNIEPQNQNQLPAQFDLPLPANNIMFELKLQVEDKTGKFIFADEVSLFTQDLLKLKVLSNLSVDEKDILWNDGRGKILNSGFTFQTRFSFPGTYFIFASANKDGLSASAQIKINVFTPKILISEFLPNPEGKDKSKEWVEFYNDNDFVADLGGYILQINDKKFVFAQPTFIYPKSFLVVPLQNTALTLTNKSGQISLSVPTGEIIDKVFYDDIPKENYAGARDLQNKNNFYWTSKPTPGFINLINPSQSVSDFVNQNSTPVSQKNKNVIILNNVENNKTVENIQGVKKINSLANLQNVASVKSFENFESEGQISEIDLTGDLVKPISIIKNNKGIITPFNIILFEIFIFATLLSIGAYLFYKKNIKIF